MPKKTQQSAVRTPPPLGLMPREIHIQKRAADILEAMLRYVREGLEIPQDWRDELENHLDDREVWHTPAPRSPAP